MPLVECGGGNGVFSCAFWVRRRNRRKSRILCFRRSRRRTKTDRSRKRCSCQTRRCVRIRLLALVRRCCGFARCCVHIRLLALARRCCGFARRFAHSRCIARLARCFSALAHCRAHMSRIVLDRTCHGYLARRLVSRVSPRRSHSVPHRKMRRRNQPCYRVDSYGFSRDPGIRCIDRCPCFLLLAALHGVHLARLHCCIMIQS